MKLEQVYDYVRYGSAALEGGLVHLRCKIPLRLSRTATGPRRGRIPSREVGDFLCSSSKGKNAVNLNLSSRDEFIIEPCHKCVAQAETFEIEIGTMWQNIPGDRVILYTTSPAYRDRWYVRRSPKPIGSYHGREVYKVEVPEDLLEITCQWYQKDLWHSWTPEMWQVLLTSGRAESGG